MKVTLYPPVRDQFAMAAMAEAYKKALLEQLYSEGAAKRAHDEWVKSPAPMSMWAFANRVAAIQTFIDLLPSERPGMTARVEFD